MNDTLKEIRRRVGEDNLTHSCSGKNCRVDMGNVPRERVVVNVDLAFKAHAETGKHCDRILFYIHPTGYYLVIVLIEHKGGTFDSATNIGEQLQGGANFAKNTIPDDINTTCVPILFHGDGNHRSQFIKLRRQQINFSGQKIPISKEKCGVPNNLYNVLKRANVLS